MPFTSTWREKEINQNVERFDRELLKVAEKIHQSFNNVITNFTEKNIGSCANWDFLPYSMTEEEQWLNKRFRHFNRQGVCQCLLSQKSSKNLKDYKSAIDAQTKDEIIVEYAPLLSLLLKKLQQDYLQILNLMI